MTKLYLFLLSLLLCTGAWAGDEGAPADNQPMSKPVTLAVKGESLLDIAAMLSKQTGVKLRVTKDIAEQKVTIFVDSRPLKDVMDGLSTIGYRWSVVNG
jgi:hypothetical protein